MVAYIFTANILAFLCSGLITAHLLRPDTSRPVKRGYIATCCVWVRILMYICHWYSGPRYLCRYSNSQRFGRSGIQSRWGARFSAPVHIGPGAHPASYTVGTVLFPGAKRPKRGADHQPHPALRLKKE